MASESRKSFKNNIEKHTRTTDVIISWEILNNRYIKSNEIGKGN